MQVDLRMILHASTLAAEKSFANASKLLHLSQPALSRSISELEKRVGSRLFDRTNGSVLPTEMGHLFLRHASGLLGKAADMGRALREASGKVVGELAVGAGVYPTDMFLGAAFGKFARQNPGVRARVVHDHVRHLIRLLEKRELEILVGDSSWLEGRDDITVLSLNAHPGYFVARAGHPLAKEKKVTLDMLLAQPFIGGSQTMPRLAKLVARVIGDTRLADRLAHWLPTIATESISMMCATAASSDGVTLLPLMSALAEVERGRLIVLPVELPWLKVAFSIMHLTHHPLSAAGERFVSAVKEADADLFAQTQKVAATLPMLWKSQDARTKRRARSG